MSTINALRRFHAVTDSNEPLSTGFPTDIPLTAGGAKRRYPVERRKHHRYTMRQRAFVLLGSNHLHPIRMKRMSMGEIALAVYKLKPAIIGEIQDFSMGGLSLIYSQLRRPLPSDAGLDILITEKSFHLSDLAFRVIFDMQVNAQLPASPVKSRYMGVAFEDLGPAEAAQLRSVFKQR